MSKEVIEVLDHICEKLGIVVDLTSQNVMPQVTDVMHRYINYKVAINSIWACTTLLSLIFTTYVLLKFVVTGSAKAKKERKPTLFYDYGTWGVEMNGIGIVTTIICIIVFVFSLANFCMAISDLLSWIFIPEVNIIRMLQRIV